MASTRIPPARAELARTQLNFDAAPPPIVRVVAALQAAGHDAFLTGPCVRALLDSEPRRDFEITTSATNAALLALFANAVVTSADDRVFTLPTESGPLDLKPMQRTGGIDAELEHRDFTLHALAYDPCARVLIDPHGGREDTTKGILRAVGDPAQRLAEDPLRALRAVRLVATLGLLIDPALGRALRSAAQALRQLPPNRVRGELRALLLGQNATQGLTLLRDSGIEARLAPGVGGDAAAVVGALPFDFDLRLAGWLRGTRATRILRDLRHPRDRVARIDRLLRLHPLDAHPRGTLDHKVRRLARRDPSEVEGLMALRAAEISARDETAEARARLDRLRVSVQRVRRAGRTHEQRNQLTLGGQEIMETLGCDPGPTVGRALRFLTDSVEEDPSRNDPDTLRALLGKWRDEN